MIKKVMNSGRVIDLLNPRPDDFEDIHRDIVLPLARLPRFAGHCGDGHYSVAQHCVLGADAILAEYDDAGAAIMFLLHDAHEAVLGDITTPVAHALNFQEASGFVLAAIARLKMRLDDAIFARFKLPKWPSRELIERVKDMDRRMLGAEVRALLAPNAIKAFDPAIINARHPILRGAIRPLSWVKAAELYEARLRTLIPAAFTDARSLHHA